MIVALDRCELAGLDELERRGRANGVPGLRRIGADELRELEPHAAGIDGLHSPQTGIVDFAGGRPRARRAAARRDGGDRRHRLRGRAASSAATARTRDRATPAARRAPAGVIVCAGAWSDRLAVAAGADPDPRIVPFRGGYLQLRPERAPSRARADLPGARPATCRSSACT